MSYFTDEEWQDLIERVVLELEVRVLAAEAEVCEAEAFVAWLDLYVVTHPDSETAELIQESKRLIHTRTRSPFSVQRAALHVERAAYGWRRDYGEWPSLLNVIDRLANESGLRHWQAARHILATINDPSDASHLYVIRSKRLVEILRDLPNDCGPVWAREGESDLCVYVSEDGQQEHGLHDWYRNECYRREAVA